MKQTLIATALLSALAFPVAAQNSARPLITNPIDETQRTTLHGNVHPLAQARYDQGAVADSFPADRVLLLLNRPPERESALQQFLSDVHRQGSPNYHLWLAPQQFGEQFGPADTDIQTLSSWLGSKGLRVAKVSLSKQFIEFSGTAGQIRDAFQTEIHQYIVNGETHYANSREISIPTALALVIRGLAPLNNFAAQPYVRSGGTARYSPTTHKVTPDWTIPNPFGTANPSAFLVAPEDLATQYDLTPLYQVGTNGTGQTIGVIDASNIDISLVSDYQQLFGIPNNPPQVIIDGDDPGDVPGDDIETYLDVEISGAMAPKSTVNLYISNGGLLADPNEFGAIRAVEDNVASVLSVSFGQCESILGNAGNQFWASLWEQAAAQGQTVLVAAGDSGPTCDEALPNSISGIASTPWNVAVGGTDFFYADYATGGASAPTFWNTTNDANLGSLKAPLTEQAWDDGFGLNIISNGLARGEFGAGGGGPSNCATISATTGDCQAGYQKPSWQSGPGVASDGVRDIPDVAFYASNGANLSAYAICAVEGECTATTASDAEIFFVGGTSASAPAMAGIMALINQKFGRQGQANFTFYALAQQKPTAFHDITLGGNNFPCDLASANCAQNVEGNDETTVYSAGLGYDMATGLGSVDANVLVTNWDSITFKPTTTTLKLSPTTITHGTPVTVTTSVAGTSGAGTPSGDVAILTNSPEPASQSQTFVTLSSGTGGSSVNFFPGGSYDVTADYQGDSVFGGSTSAPVSLKVNPEDSTITLSILSGSAAVVSGGSVLYNSPLTLSVEPIGASSKNGVQDGNATGSATFTIDSITTTIPMDSIGLASWNAPTLAVGSHTASATYSGDASFNSSSAAPVTFTVTKGIPSLNDNIFAPEPGPGPAFLVTPGASLMVTVQVAAHTNVPGTAAPIGTVMACLGTSINEPCLNPIYTQTGTLMPPSGIYAQISTATVTFPNVAAGFYNLSFTYSGDTNWSAESLVDSTEINVVAPAALTASTTTLSLTPASVSGTQLAQVSTTITGSGNSGIAPTGVVNYYNNGLFLTQDILTPTGAQTATAMFQLGTGSFFNNGANQITAFYQGDKNYLPSISNVASISVAQVVGNFTLTPQLSQITVQPGQSTSVGIGLTSVSNFNGVVSLSCTTSSPQITCVGPASTMLNGAATPMLMVTALSEAVASPNQPDEPLDSKPGTGVGIVLASLLLISLAVRKRRPTLLRALGLFAAILLIAGCGGGSGNSQPPPPPPPAAATYTVVVSATANNIVHNAKITVFVP
jgi:subtilase family serine protease